MSFTNITDEELIGKGVTGLPDTPGLSTEDMQAKFDEYSVFLKDKFKTLISELEAVSGALNIGAEVPQNISAEGNIQSILNGLRQYVDDTVIALGTGDMATGIYDPDRDGIISPEQGGTGQASLRAARNAMGLGDTTGALPIANGGTGQTTAEGIRGVLGLGSTIGALPITNGGTGASNVANARTNLGLGSVATESIVPIVKGGIGKTSWTQDTVLVGNGQSTPTERSIDTTSGGTDNSTSLITSGAVKSKFNAIETSFQAGVDTIYNACATEGGVTPSNSTPTAIAQAIPNIRGKGRNDAGKKGTLIDSGSTMGASKTFTGLYGGFYYLLVLLSTDDSPQITSGVTSRTTRASKSHQVGGISTHAIGIFMETTATEVTVSNTSNVLAYSLYRLGPST